MIQESKNAGGILIGRYLKTGAGPYTGEIFVIRDIFSYKDSNYLLAYGIINQHITSISFAEIYKYQELFYEQLENGTTLIHDYDKIVTTVNGFLHCDCGPAVRFSKNPAKNVYALKGIKYYSKEEYFELLTDEQKEKIIWDINNF